MGERVKLRYIVLCLALLAVISSATVFSLSYAKWSSGTTQFQASALTGTWSIFSRMEDSEILSNISGEARPNILYPQYGGIYASNGQIIAARWYNSYGEDGYSGELNLSQYDTFVVAIFGRVWEYGKEINSGNGYCVYTLHGNASEYIRVDGKIFTALQACRIRFSVHEAGTGQHDDMVEITVI